MRATALDAALHPSYIGDWWLELPGRRRSWWRGLLFEKGQGWLCWRMGQRQTAPSGYYEPPETYTVAPPLRRLALALRYRQRWPLSLLRDEDRKRGGAL